jgi:hypothetical protein
MPDLETGAPATESTYPIVEIASKLGISDGGLQQSQLTSRRAPAPGT